MNQDECEVLVAGAGPSGLSAALFLGDRGHRVMILDKNEHRSEKSKAIGVQPGTLELFEAAFGPELPAEMMAAGQAAREIHFHTGNGRIFNILFSQVPSTYNALLLLKQSETERILERKLAERGVKVSRLHELTDFKQDNRGVYASVKSAGKEKQFHAKYLIGCDGAHSSVRRRLGIEFGGGTYEGHFVLADLRVDWPWGYETVRTFLSPAGAAAFFPLKGEQLYRLILIPRSRTKTKESVAESEHEITLELLRRLVAPFVPREVRLSNPVWMTRFRVHHRMSEKMGEGRVFLCGDAAHIHSPLGAQGMNTGIHDGLDLSWRLSQILRGLDGPDLLNGFLKERHRNAQQVVRFTDLAFRAVMAPENVLSAFGRRHIAPLVIPLLQKRLLRAVSEIDVARKIAKNLKN